MIIIIILKTVVRIDHDGNTASSYPLRKES